MTIDTRAFALAAGAAAATTSLACALLLLIAPDFAVGLFGAAVHADLSSLPRHVTVGTVAVSVAFWAVVGALVFGLGGWLYNALQHQRGALTSADSAR